MRLLAFLLFAVQLSGVFAFGPSTNFQVKLTIKTSTCLEVSSRRKIPQRKSRILNTKNNRRHMATTAGTMPTPTSPNTQAVEEYLVENPKKLDTAIFIWFLPLINMVSAFFLYTRTQQAFRALMDSASGRLWINVDGNQYMSEIVKPVLNGPVTLSISILFGTLISMTIQTLYRRQISLHQTLIGTVEEVRELQWLVEGFPEPYRRNSHTLLAQFLHKSFQDFETQSVTPESIRTKEMTQMLVLLNDLSKQRDVCPDIIVCEAYGCVHRLKDRRAEFMSGLQTVFSSAHYFVISLLAMTLLFVFLLETDNDTLQFLLDFQLSICWALLIGTYSMLAVVIYDLARPFTGIFTTMRGVDFVANEMATEVVPEIMVASPNALEVLDEEWEAALAETLVNGLEISDYKNGLYHEEHW